MAVNNTSSVLIASDIIDGAKRLLGINPTDPPCDFDVDLLRDLNGIHAWVAGKRHDLLRNDDGTMATLPILQEATAATIVPAQYRQNMIYLLAAFERQQDSADTFNAQQAATWQKMGEAGLIG